MMKNIIIKKIIIIIVVVVVNLIDCFNVTCNTLMPVIIAMHNKIM